MSYTQDKLDKLDEFDKRFLGSTTDDDNYQSEYEIEFTNDIRKWIKQVLTDYHNHIVEKIVKDVDMTDQQLQDILSLLQDTNK